MLSEHRGESALSVFPSAQGLRRLSSGLCRANPGGSEDQLTSQTQGTPPPDNAFEAVVINFVELFCFIQPMPKSMVFSTL